MTRRALLLALLAAVPALLPAAYTYYYSDTLTSINGAYWTTNGTVTATSNGLTATSTNGGSIISLVTPPGTFNEYEVKSTLRLTASGGTYVHYLRASADAMSGPAAQGTYYSVELQNPTINQGACSAGLVLNKRVGGSITQIYALTGVPCHDGMELRAAYSNAGILVFLDGACYMHLGDVDISAGQPGIGAFGTPAGNSISSVALGPHDGTAPAVVDRNALAVTPFPTSVEMQWQPPSDGASGVGLWRYLMFRNGTFLGLTQEPEYVDHGAAASQTYVYTILTQDQHANWSALDFNVTTPPAGSIDPRRTGVRPTGSYWGAGGEQIDMLSGNLNFTLPLLQGKGRGGLSATLALNYNSQIWRQDTAGTWRFGKDLGYGFGWRLMLGSITPYWSDYFTLHHYIYTDSSGAEYRLDVNSGNVWRSKDSIYLWYDAGTSRLYFRDGTFWVMGAISAGTEQDAGTRYPTLIQDTNGNQIVVEYKTGLGVSWANSSARVYEVRDVRNHTHAYRFNYNTDAIPHLTGVQNYIATSEGYTFAYSDEQTLNSPFTPSTQFGATRMLTSVTTVGLNLTHQFAYGTNQSGELTKVTFPYGGYLEWSHASLTLLGGRTHREVQNRYLAKNGGDTKTQHILYRDSGDVNRTIHVGAWLSDTGAPGMKVWTFLWSGTGAWYDGLQQQYEDLPADWTAPGTRRQQFTWAQDAGSNPYISVATTTLNPGQSYAKVSKVEQTLDVNGWGNVLWTKIYNYGDLVTPARTYTNTYLTDTNHTNRYIRNRLLTTTLTSGGQNITLVTNTYGGSYQGLTDITNPTLHDTAYGTGFTYRGNLVSRTVPGKPAGYFKYDIAGNVRRTTDAQGHTVDLTTTSATNYTAPSVVTPNSTTDLASSFTYTSFLGIATATAPNASTSSYTYDTYARPATTTSPHGAVTNYTYDDTPLAAFEKATTNNKWVKKTKDGLGRVVLVETGYSTTTVSKVTTEYAPCSCSPMGRVWRVSQPYTTTPTAWTTYTYDALGRTTCVSLPGNSGSTTYVYEGNAVTVTDPAGRWKKYETDAFGNVTKVTEPNPQGGANHETTYAYDMFNRLTTVSMPRGGTTQTRTFAYNTLGQLQSTANPENGTTTLAYNTDGTLFSKTDQKAQRIEYSYDSFRRVSQVRKYQSNGLEDTCQRVNYYYDTNPYESTFTQNGWGRLAVVEYGGSNCMGGRYRESYSYTPGGLPVKKKLRVNDDTLGTGSLLGEWSYDNEGKMLTVKYPDTYDWQGNPATGRTYTYGYNSMGRLATLVDNRPGDPPGWEWVSAATYNVAGQLTYMTGWNGLSETRQYNERLQLTQIQQNGPDIQYYYPDAQNNDGRITRQVVNGVEKAYTYDSLGRLATAGSASYTYDGFGNRLQQTSPAMYLVYNPANNRITTTGYSYDNNGNLNTMPNLTMSYDVENRLVEAVHTQNGTERYRYSPSGQRVWKRKPVGTNEWYFYGVDGRLIGTYVRCQYYGTLFQEQSTNVYFGGRTLQAQGQTGMKQDRLGTTSYSPMNYAPYGDTGISPPPYGDGLGFTGYYRDGTTTGLDYAQQRYYAPSIGRFTTADPYLPSAAIARPQSWNRYAYVENDPVNMVDPDGLLQRMLDPAVWDWRPTGDNDHDGHTGGGGGANCGGNWWRDASLSGPCYVSLPNPEPAPEEPVRPTQTLAGLLLMGDCYDRSPAAYALGGGAAVRRLTYLPVDERGAPYIPSATIEERNTVIQGRATSINTSWTVSGGQTFDDYISSGSDQEVFQEVQSFFLAGSSDALTINWFFGGQYKVLGVYATPNSVKINKTYPVNKDGTPHYCDEPDSRQVR